MATSLFATRRSKLFTAWTRGHGSHRHLRIISFPDSCSYNIQARIAAPKPYFRGIHGINGNYIPSNPSKNRESDERDIPPLDLLSTLDVSPAVKTIDDVKQNVVPGVSTDPNASDLPPLSISSTIHSANMRTQSGIGIGSEAFTETTTGLNAIDIPPLDLLSLIPSNTSEHTADDSPSEQKRNRVSDDIKSDNRSSNKAAILSEEIAYIERKLRNKPNLAKGHAFKLRSQLKMKRNALDRLKVNIFTADESNNSFRSDIQKEYRRAKNRKRSKQRQRAKERLKAEANFNGDPNTASQFEQIKNFGSSRSEFPRPKRRREHAVASDGDAEIAYPLRPTKSFVLPRPKASPRGVLIPHFDSDIIQTQANGTILASSGTTSILSTVILVPPDAQPNHNKSFEQTVIDCIQQRNAQNGSLFLPLQVEYRERWHASGKIPTHNQRRRDNSGPLSEREVLASRAIDRTLRPWLMKGLGESSLNGEGLNGNFFPENIVVNCEVQAYDTRSSTLVQQRTHADPTALAINAAIATIYQSAYSGNVTNLPVPLDAAACIKLAMRRDGNVIYDPTPAEAEECAFELLFAGTRDHVLMLEFSAKGEKYSADDIRDKYSVDPGISEDIVADALRLAKEAILPIIHYQEDLRLRYSADQDLPKTGEEIMALSDKDLARALGLPNNTETSTVVVCNSSVFDSRDSVQLLDDAYTFVWSKLEMAALKSFGYDGQSMNESSMSLPYIHTGDLLPKKLRYVV